jgi:hypothetical protein
LDSYPTHNVKFTWLLWKEYNQLWYIDNDSWSHYFKTEPPMLAAISLSFSRNVSVAASKEIWWFFCIKVYHDILVVASRNKENSFEEGSKISKLNFYIDIVQLNWYCGKTCFHQVKIVSPVVCPGLVLHF